MTSEQVFAVRTGAQRHIDGALIRVSIVGDDELGGFVDFGVSHGDWGDVVRLREGDQLEVPGWGPLLVVSIARSDEPSRCGVVLMRLPAVSEG